MRDSWLIVLSTAIQIVGYIFYGRYLTRRYDLDYERATPANTNVMVLTTYQERRLSYSGIISPPLLVQFPFLVRSMPQFSAGFQSCSGSS